MAAKKKSSFYHTRWNKVGINEQRASEVLGVTIEQVKEWDLKGAPVTAERLLILWDKKHVGVDGWDGWLFSRNNLQYKGQRFWPENILAARFEMDKIHRLEHQIKKLHSWNGLLKIVVYLCKAS